MDSLSEDIRILEEVKRPTLATGFERQTNLLKAIKITLNLIEKQQAEIDKYKEMYAVSIADRVNSAFKQKYKNDEDLEMLYKGCQIELEKKDKIIDLMAEWFEEWAEFIDEENYYTIFRKMSKEDIKEYFKKKVEENE